MMWVNSLQWQWQNSTMNIVFHCYDYYYYKLPVIQLGSDDHFSTEVTYTD